MKWNSVFVDRVRRFSLDIDERERGTRDFEATRRPVARPYFVERCKRVSWTIYFWNRPAPIAAGLDHAGASAEAFSYPNGVRRAHVSASLKPERLPPIKPLRHSPCLFNRPRC